MGTSLSGLTPATTFDGLLKTGDNEPLDGTLKAISTGDGTDTILQLSDSALSIGGDTTISTSNTWAQGFNSNLRLESDSPSIQLKRPDGVTSGLMIGVSGSTTYFAESANNDMSSISYVGRIVQGKWGFGNVNPTATTHIKGSGATSATTSLLVQNSAGTTALEVLDNRDVKLNLGTYQFLSSGFISYAKGNVDNNFGVGFTTSPTARLHVKGAGNDNTTTSLLVQNSDATELLKVTDDGESIFKTDSNFIVEKLDGTDLIKAQSGSTRVLLTNGIYNFNSSYFLSYADIRANNNIIVGATTLPTARMQVKGSGATSATTALLVQNSAGTDLFKVQDNGQSQFYGIVNFRSGAQLMMQVNPDAGIIDFNPQNLAYDTRFRGDTTSNLIYVDASADKVGMNTNTPTAQLHVKGSGNDATTTALLVQDSAGADLMAMRDDGVLILGAPGNRKFFEGGAVNSKFRVIDNSSLHTVHADGSTNPRVFLRSGPNNSEPNSHYVANYINGTYIGKDVVTPTSTLQVKGSGNDATSTALLVQNSDGDEALKVTDDVKVSIGAIKLSNIKAINSDLRFDVGGTGTIKVVSDKVAIGGNITPTARLQVKGSGATSATTALLVENSAGTEAFKVLDNGEVVIPTTSTFKVSSFSVQLGRIYPTTQDGDLGWNASTSYHFRNIYSKGVTHITDNTTSSTTLDASAKLQVDSTTQGFLPPRMTDAERDAIVSPAAGLMIYDTSNNQMNYWNGSTWIAF